MGYTHTMTDIDEENEYPKLVRDRIPEIIHANDGIEAAVRVLGDQEFEARLRQKAIEEAHELAAAESDQHLLEEIADVREILDTLQELKGFSDDQVQAVQEEKRTKRGGFKKKLLMLRKAGQ